MTDTPRIPWTRRELLLAMNLYYRIPFGRQHERAPEILELARSLNRTPGSVAMKLNNITSLDPSEAARGVHGLRGASRLDRSVWEEFHSDPERLAAESETLWDEVVASSVSQRSKRRSELGEPKMPRGETEAHRVQRVRCAQSFFRKVLLAAYGDRCCISGIAVPQLLVASHILPWADYPEHRVNPRNGLCLSSLYDAAFDRHLITFDEDNRLVLGATLHDHLTNAVLRASFVPFEGCRFHADERQLKLPPDDN